MRRHVAGAVVVAITVTGCTTSSPRQPRPSASPAPGIASTELVYRVVDRSGATPQVSTLIEEAAPPYVGALVTRAGPPPGGASLGGTAWGANGVTLLDPDGSARQIEQAPPGFTGADTHLDVALNLAERLGWARRICVTTVGQRPCTRWLSGPPLDSGTISPATRVDHTLSCVDAAGRIVHDVWSRLGRVVRVRTLVSMGSGPLLSADGTPAGVVPTPVPTPSAVQLTRRVPAAKLAQLMGVRLPAAPPGLRRDLAVASVSLAADGTTDSESATFTYLGAGRLAVVEYTRTLHGIVAPRPRSGLAARFGHAATGRITPVLAGLRADLVTADGLQVIATSDLPLPAFVTWLRATERR